MIAGGVAGFVRRLSATLARARLAAAAWLEQRRAPVLVKVVDAEPADLASRRLYVSVRAGAPAVGWLRCPCGCRDVISLRLAGDRRPRWSLASAEGIATLHPSIWRQAGCRSHFILKNGRIRWC